MNDPVSEFTGEIFTFLSGKNHLTSKTVLIKRHTENLETYGDFSFVNALKPWRDHLLNISESEKTLTMFLNKKNEDLLSESAKWVFRISRVREDKDRLCLYVDRPISIKVGLKSALYNHQIVAQRLFNEVDCVNVDPMCLDKTDITYLRLQHLAECIKNLCAICLENPPCISVSFKSSSKCQDGVFPVLCGPVINAKSGAKEVQIKSEEYLGLRQNDMLLVAQHKYGVRVSKDPKWKEFIDNLGESAVAFEMLQIKPSNPVKINFECLAESSSKGAAFVLYNCARLENILKTFNHKVEQKLYPELPDLEEIDWSLLSDEDEWILIFTYIMGLPSLLKNAAIVKEKSCEFRPHMVCSYLSSMVRIVSQYYRRVRILTEPRKHLLPVLFARIHMLKILNDTLKLCLRIINIKSVQQIEMKKTVKARKINPSFTVEAWFNQQLSLCEERDNCRLTEESQLNLN